MAGGFKFSIDFDSSAFKRGSDGAADSLEQLGEALDDVGRADTSDAERGVEDIGAAADDAARRADDLAGQFRDTFTSAASDSRTAGDAIGDNLEGPLTSTQDMMNEVRSSLTESMGELAGSFAENGFNMEDAIDGVVEVSAEAAGALPGPWGLAGSALVAVAAGVYGEWKARQDAIAEDAAEMYQDMLDSGAEFLSNDYFQKKLGEFFDPMGESYDSNMDKLDVLADLGVPMDEAAQALVGYGDLSDEVFGKLHDQVYGSTTATAGLGFAYDVLGQGTRDVMAGIIRDVGDSKTSADRARDAVDKYRTSIEDIPDDVDTKVDVDDKGSVKKTQRKIDDIDGKEVTVRAKVDRSAVDSVLQSLSYERPVVNVDVRYRRVGGFYP